MKKCRKCGAEWNDKRTPGMREECEECLSPWHSCCNCRFYDEDASQWCREPMARDEKPRDPENANNCSYFLLNDSDDSPTIKKNSELAAIFGEDPADEEKPAADWMNHGRSENSLEDIFKPPDQT